MPRHEGNLGTAARGSVDSRSCSRIAFDCNGRKATIPSDHRLLRHLNPSSLARRRRIVARRTNRRRLVLLRAARDERGQKQVHAPPHGRKRRGRGCAARKGPRSRALTGSGRACSPGDQGHAWASGSPGCAVKRSLDRQAMLVFERSVGCSCTWVSCRCRQDASSPWGAAGRKADSKPRDNLLWRPPRRRRGSDSQRATRVRGSSGRTD